MQAQVNKKPRHNNMSNVKSLVLLPKSQQATSMSRTCARTAPGEQLTSIDPTDAATQGLYGVLTAQAALPRDKLVAVFPEKVIHQITQQTKDFDQMREFYDRLSAAGLPFMHRTVDAMARHSCLNEYTIRLNQRGYWCTCIGFDNAVECDNLELVDFLVRDGIRPSSRYVVEKIKSVEMAKLLILDHEIISRDIPHSAVDMAIDGNNLPLLRFYVEECGASWSHGQFMLYHKKGVPVDEDVLMYMLHRTGEIETAACALARAALRCRSTKPIQFIVDGLAHTFAHSDTCYVMCPAVFDFLVERNIPLFPEELVKCHWANDPSYATVGAMLQHIIDNHPTYIQAIANKAAELGNHHILRACYERGVGLRIPRNVAERVLGTFGNVPTLELLHRHGDINPHEFHFNGDDINAMQFDVHCYMVCNGATTADSWGGGYGWGDGIELPKKYHEAGVPLSQALILNAIRHAPLEVLEYMYNVAGVRFEQTRESIEATANRAACNPNKRAARYVLEKLAEVAGRSDIVTDVQPADDIVMAGRADLAQDVFPFLAHAIAQSLNTRMTFLICWSVEMMGAMLRRCGISLPSLDTFKSPVEVLRYMRDVLKYRFDTIPTATMYRLLRRGRPDVFRFLIEEVQVEWRCSRAVFQELITLKACEKAECILKNGRYGTGPNDTHYIDRIIVMQSDTKMLECLLQNGVRCTRVNADCALDCGSLDALHVLYRYGAYCTAEGINFDITQNGSGKHYDEIKFAVLNTPNYERPMCEISKANEEIRRLFNLRFG